MDEFNPEVSVLAEIPQNGDDEDDKWQRWQHQSQSIVKKNLVQTYKDCNPSSRDNNIANDGEGNDGNYCENRNGIEENDED